MEQEINNIQETTVETIVHKPESKELFESYEINKRTITSSFQKIIAGTVVFHILALAVLSQTGFGLGKSRACQNPLMQTVCEVIDMAYVGSVLAGTDRTSVDSAYVKTELEDAEITFIDVTNQPPPFAYPEDYFSVANPESALQETITDAFGNPISNDTIAGIPGFPNSGTNTPTDMKGFPSSSSLGSLDVNKPSVLPTPNSGTLSGPIPSSSSSFGTNPIPPTKNRRNNSSGFPTTPSTKKTPKIKSLPDDSPGSLGDLGGDETVAGNDKPNKNEPKKPNGVTQDLSKGNVAPTPEKFNKRPLKDFGKDVNKQIANKQIDLNSPVALMMKGVLSKDGKLDPKKSKFVSAQGDEKMVKVIQSGIMAINDSGYLALLEQLSGKTLDISFLQDDANIIAEVQSEMESDTRAKTTKGLLDLAIKFGKSKKNAAIIDPKNTEIQNDKDELALLETAVVEIVGKKVIIRFNVTKDFAQEMIARKLKDLADDEAKEIQKTNKLDVISENKNKNANIAKK